MPQIVFPEFRDTTRSIKYPFVDGATLTASKVVNASTTGETITLPNDIFIDISLFLPTDKVLTGFPPSLVYIHVTKNAATVMFSYGSGGTTYYNGNDNACYGVIDLHQDIEDEDITIPLYMSKLEQDNYGAATSDKTKRVGTLVMNKLKLAYLKGLSPANYVFGGTATLVPSCAVVVPRFGVNSISVNTRTAANTISGKVWLIGHNGVFVRTDDNVEGRIRIDVVGDALYKKAALGVESYEYAKPIRSINGIPSDEFGGFKLTTSGSNDALRITTNSTGVTVFMAGAMNGD